MAVTSTRRVIVNFSGDIEAQIDKQAANNALSPGQIQILALSAGNNTITPPAGSTGVTILPPSGNTVLLTLKGVGGDTGVPLHLTDPTSIGLNSIGTFVLNALAVTVTIRLVWS